MGKFTKNQIILIVIVVLIAVAAGGYLIYRVQSFPKSKIAENTQTQISSGQNQQTQTPPADNNTSATKTFSYNDALKMYADRRIQFDANCQATPYYNTFKNGTRVMLDNRLNSGRSVYLNDTQYYLGPYGFRIITLSATGPLPYTIMIDCGTGKNNGTIVLH